VPVALGLGANLGDPQRQLRWAVRELDRLIGPLETGSLYLTAPHSHLPQPRYFNTAVVGQTDLSAPELLTRCKQLEAEGGRQPGPRFGPRHLDIDLLLYGGESVRGDALTVPHPRLLQRRFALAPLADVAADWSIPGSGLTVAEALDRVGQKDEVERVGWG
jgi:2-amino-4-hydroxy-6-hydroxymethyldihydropteridine diphosphokinase